MVSALSAGVSSTVAVVGLLDSGSQATGWWPWLQVGVWVVVTLWLIGISRILWRYRIKTASHEEFQAMTEDEQKAFVSHGIVLIGRKKE